QLGVSSETLARHGAVSESCAIEMCRGVRERLKSDIGVSITGVAGPDGGTAEKPVGTVWLGLSTPERELAVPWSLPWERTRIQRYAAQLALDIVRRDLLGYPLHWERK
ncbi:MAG: nicotinamide-nucleotide amidohydrolase family protein, partial [Deltaproteobacteria bacterium]|nr:nicotinamide-nucleotide amidohydrolase family protein [Deltaproteobacteria bacterium]